MINNEEEVRSKILLPYLSDLGFELSEITLEDSFTIRLGRNEKQIRGRSDMLCKRNNNNLFVIEVKKDTHRITQDDIDQGISYSRALVGNIAPFTIISNGKNTKIFDTITKAELTGTKISEQSDFWKNGCTLSMDDDLRIRYDALINFISFSEENLKVFCRGQVNDRIKLISGDIYSSRAKYIESIHAQRPKLRLNYQKFLNSDCSVFGLVGNAGVGKTCSMCSLALDSIGSNFIFFYNGTLLKETIIDTISRDLNLFFSTKNKRDVVLNKLDELARFTNKNVIIFIDAVDEVISKNFSIELSEITYSISKLKKIKLFISCKSTVWNRFLIINETENHTYNELKKFHQISPDLNNPGYQLKEFDDEEFNDVILTYRSSFKFKGELSKNVYNKLKNGFFLRIFSEVYQNKNVPPEINDTELIEKYLTQSLKRTSIDLQVGLRILGKIGIATLKYDSSKYKFQSDFGIDINVILDELNLPIDSDLPQELFDRNILIKSGDGISYQLSFYYSTIRDYIICYHSYRLDKIDNELFYNNLESFFENYIGQSAILFYLENASVSKLNVYRRFKEDKLLSYAVKYNNFLDENFSKIKKEFDPKTISKIGIVIPEDLVKQDGYALFPLSADSNKIVHYDGFDQPMNIPANQIRIFKKGVRTFYSSNSSLMVRDQVKLIKINVYKQLKKIVEKGLLYEYDSDIILLEKVSSILYYHYKKLDYPFIIEDYYIPRFDQIYPLNLIELRDKLYKFRAEHYFKREKVERNLIPKLIERAFKTGQKIPSLNVSGDFPPFEELFKIVNILLDRGFDIIQSHYLPSPDISLDDVKKEYYRRSGVKLNERRIAQFSNEQMKKYVKVFFEKLEVAYRQIVESCFPTLIDKLTFYNNIPHEFIFYINDLSEIKHGCYGYKKSSNGKFHLIYKSSKKSENFFKNEDGIKTLRVFSFDRFIHINNPIKTVRRINTNKVDVSCVVRNWAYQILINDLNKIVKKYDIQIYRSMNY